MAQSIEQKNSETLTANTSSTNSTSQCNRFKLVILAVQRARDLNVGAKKLVSYDSKDKEPVIALREIEQNKLNLEELEMAVIKNHQSYVLDRSGVKKEGLIDEIEKAFGQNDTQDESAMIYDSEEDLVQEVESVSIEDIEEDLDYISSPIEDINLSEEEDNK